MTVPASALSSAERRKWLSTALVDAVRRAGVRDERVLDAFRSVDRTCFVPTGYAIVAHRDDAIPIGYGQVTTQPSLIGHMVEALRLRGTERVLEVGTGFGYQTAILASLADRVCSIEIVAELADQARENLACAGIDNATVVVGDGTLGLPAYAPYQAIVVSAAAPIVPPALVEQLDRDGRLVQPIGHGGNEMVVAFRKHDSTLVEERMLTAACFVPLIGGARGQ